MYFTEGEKVSEMLTCEWCDCDVVSDEAVTVWDKKHGRAVTCCENCIRDFAKDRDIVLAYSKWSGDPEDTFGRFVYDTALNTLGATREKQIEVANRRVHKIKWDFLVSDATEYLFTDKECFVKFLLEGRSNGRLQS